MFFLSNFYITSLHDKKTAKLVKSHFMITSVIQPVLSTLLIRTPDDNSMLFPYGK